MDPLGQALDSTAESRDQEQERMQVPRVGGLPTILCVKMLLG